MVRDTGIEWTDDTWNVFRGCSRTIAEGATTSGCGDPTGGGCYAERNGYRFTGPGMAYEGLVRMTPNGARWTGAVKLIDHVLLDPLRWKEPRSIFTTSVSDPFHERFSNETIAIVYGVMAATRRHTHQLLTKRTKRMHGWYWWVADEAARANGGRGMSVAAYCFCLLQRYVADRTRFSDADRKLVSRGDVVAAALGAAWPLENLWTGASVEHQAAAYDRIDDLMMVPSVLRWLSCEPLIGEVDLLPWFDPTGACDCPPGQRYCVPRCMRDAPWRGAWDGVDPELGWVVAGCESGPRSRASNTEWFRLLRDRCADARVPFFFKQGRGTWSIDSDDMAVIPSDDDDTPADEALGRVLSTPMLDGRTHTDRPVRTVNTGVA